MHDEPAGAGQHNVRNARCSRPVTSTARSAAFVLSVLRWDRRRTKGTVIAQVSVMTSPDAVSTSGARGGGWRGEADRIAG
jgi:hypothetical protein